MNRENIWYWMILIGIGIDPGGSAAAAEPALALTRVVPGALCHMAQEGKSVWNGIKLFLIF